MASTAKNPAIIAFPPFQLDLGAGQLRREGAPVRLRPKTYALLQHLAERPGELVTKQALLDAVWRDVAVSEDVVRISAGELRAALGDNRAAPRFIETVPRRGYRFIARMSAAAPGVFTAAAAPAISTSSAESVVVGRLRERALIAQWLGGAMSGQPQFGFVTGEAGIGKTTLIDTALRELERASATRLYIAHGQCIEHYGGGEAYMPVLAALAMLCRGPDGPTFEAKLRRHAPHWLLGAMGVAAAEQLTDAPPGATTHELTLHRLATCLNALAADTPLVLVLEDVQWSDYSTLDVLSILAQRREPARLLVLCTLRPTDAIVRGHPVMGVKRELLRKGLCREILLGGLPAADIASYLAARFPVAELPEDLLALLVDRSDGSPFFMVALVDYLLEQRLLVHSQHRWELREKVQILRTAIPDGLRAVIEPRLERLTPEELSVLEAASVAGLEFPVHALTRATMHDGRLGDIESVERLCDGLARRQEILRATGESDWPDGTVSTRYAFLHAFYREVISQRISPSTRRRLHQEIGETLETAYSGRTEIVANELAAHFESSRDVERAVRYHQEAAGQARARFAYGETRLHLEAALALMQSQPETAEQLRQEIALLDDLGWTAFALRGWGDEGGARAFARLGELAERSEGARSRFRAMEGQLIVHTMRAEYATARVRAEEMLELAEYLGGPTVVANTLPPYGAVLIHVGELEAAHRVAERGRSLCDPNAPTIQGVSILSLLAATSAHLGLAAQARAMNDESITLAEKLGFPYARAHAANFAAAVCALLGDVTQGRALAEEAVRVATECDFSVLRATATIFRGWGDVNTGHVEDGLAALRLGFAEYAATGQRISTSSYGLRVVEGYLASGDITGANEGLDRALAFLTETGERLYEHEIHRLRGECMLAGPTRGRKADAIVCFERAIAIAAEQQALLFELRAATSLYRVQKSARERVMRLLDRFGVDDDCADTRAARALLGATGP